MASVTMQCPECQLRKTITDGESYNQQDLVCPNGHGDLVIATTSSEPPSEVVPAEVVPGEVDDDAEPEPEVEQFDREGLARRQKKTADLERDVRDAEADYERIHKQAQRAKKDVELAIEELRSYIRSGQAPALLPLFDGKPVPDTEPVAGTAPTEDVVPDEAVVDGKTEAAGQ